MNRQGSFALYAMNPKYKKIYCCTPVAFQSNDGFWIRDTGLICTSLRNMGVESKCIMPLPFYNGDQTEHLIRTEYKNLKSVAWWKSLGIDALVLYSWGAPKYLPIARAVKKAGIRLMIHMDCTDDIAGAFGTNTPLYKRAAKLIRCTLADIFRVWHLKQADTITMGETAAEHLSSHLFYGKWLLNKLFPTPCPVSPLCKYNGEEKKDTILCIGRWDDVVQKRPIFMMQTLEHYYKTGGTAITKIFGTITDKLKEFHSKLPSQIAEKIHLCGYIANHQLRTQYKEAKIILCPSSFESSHIVSAEGLCCGCSVVVPFRLKPLRDICWYTTKNSGTISQKDTPESLAQAIHREINEWACGKRNPYAIAEAWQPYFHVDKVFNKIFQ